MPKTYSIITFLVALLLNCSNKLIYIDYTGTIEEDEYWHAVIDAKFGAFLNLNFQILSGSAVDVILMDQSGFQDFRERIVPDTLIIQDYDLFPESYAADFCFFNCGDDIVYSYCWSVDSGPPLPIDVFIMDRDNYNFFIQNLPYEAFVIYDSVIYIHDTLEVPVDDYIYFIIDNTVLHGSPPLGRVFYNLKVAKLFASSFPCFSDISHLNCDSIVDGFQRPFADTLYLVINNSGYVIGGAEPTGAVEFHIFVEED